MSMDANQSGIPLVDSEDAPLNSSINTTPLVDIMLVLLIIFLITVPVAMNSVDVSLPEERVKVVETKPDNVYLAVDANGQVWWNRYPIPNEEELARRLREAAARKPQPEVHISGDQNTEYLNVGKVVEAAQRAGIMKVAFLTEKPFGVR